MPLPFENSYVVFCSRQNLKKRKRIQLLDDLVDDKSYKELKKLAEDCNYQPDK